MTLIGIVGKKFPLTGSAKSRLISSGYQKKRSVHGTRKTKNITTARI